MLVAIAFLGAFFPSASARATPDFPGAVAGYLMLPSDWIASKVDPPDGCHLCHVNGSAGGEPLTDFGSLMQANGAIAYAASTTAGPALSAIESMEPQLITDLKNGTDPNVDQGAFNANHDAVYQHGCGSIAPGSPSAAGGAVTLTVLGWVLFAHRRMRSVGAGRRLRRARGPCGPMRLARRRSSSLRGPTRRCRF
jgi:hypothetical protein